MKTRRTLFAQSFAVTAAIALGACGTGVNEAGLSEAADDEAAATPPPPVASSTVAPQPTPVDQGQERMAAWPFPGGGGRGTTGGFPFPFPGGGGSGGFPGIPGIPGLTGGGSGGFPGIPGIPGLTGGGSGGIPGLTGGIPGLTGGIPGLTGGIPGLTGGIPGLTTGGAGGIPGIPGLTTGGAGGIPGIPGLTTGGAGGIPGLTGGGTTTTGGSGAGGSSTSTSGGTTTGGGSATPSGCDPSTWSAAWAGLESQVLTLVNQQRAHGASCGGTPYPAVPALAPQAQLQAAARKHACDMAKNNYFAHNSQDGTTPWARMNAEGYRYSAAAENIAAGASSAADVVKMWMNSPGHCTNIMSGSVTQLGVGYYASSGGSTYGTYWVQDFGRP